MMQQQHWLTAMLLDVYDDIPNSVAILFWAHSPYSHYADVDRLHSLYY